MFLEENTAITRQLRQSYAVVSETVRLVHRTNHGGDVETLFAPQAETLQYVNCYILVIILVFMQARSYKLMKSGQ